nr:type IA DNA topoisomerase [Methylomarinum sp. Ch1-1]MDP4523355.1 type IA DNA topoisomerase [Methylomarinum sp. Ch1-1]
MNLLIVESPTKAKHISHLLGNDWVVRASMGHIRDLPVNGEAAYVRPPQFKMNYVVMNGKEDTVKALKSYAKKADAVYLATDPDREGESIAWHLCRVLGIKVSDSQRVTYQEVTEAAIRKAIASPTQVNMHLVAAQESRRGLDRMVGWEVSGPLSRSLDTKASAGRVQSPALRLIVERERKIRNFKPTDYYQVLAHMPDDWRATWQDGTKEGEYFQDKAFADALAAALPGMTLNVVNAGSKPVKRSPPPPFTTSALQQDGSRALKIGTEDVMRAAQALFEAGAITYHRTDSPNLSEEGESSLRAEAEQQGYPLSEKPRRWKAKGDAQEAHEAIRPTDPSMVQAGNNDIQRALYSLIRNRAIASQLADAIYQQTSATLDGGEFQGRQAIFKASGRTLVSPGWLTLYQESKDEHDETESSNPVPLLEKGASVSADRGESRALQTKPPAAIPKQR